MAIHHRVDRALPLARRRGVWQWAWMIQRTPLAGGCFLTAAIVAGVFGGLAMGNPMKGILIGTAAGAAAALLLWLLDRRRA